MHLCLAVTTFEAAFLAYMYLQVYSVLLGKQEEEPAYGSSRYLTALRGTAPESSTFANKGSARLGSFASTRSESDSLGICSRIWRSDPPGKLGRIAKHRNRGAFECKLLCC